MRVFATMFVLFASLSLAGCGQSGDPEINKLLDNFESLVSDFEKMANQDKVCFSEISEIMPKLWHLVVPCNLQSAGKRLYDQRQRAAKLAIRLHRSGIIERCSKNRLLDINKNQEKRGIIRAFLYIIYAHADAAIPRLAVILVRQGQHALDGKTNYL